MVFFGERDPNLRVDIPGEDGGVLLFILAELFLLENKLRLLFVCGGFLLGDTDVSVTSNPSWIIDPGTGRNGPTYRKNVSSTPMSFGVLDMEDATSSMVV